MVELVTLTMNPAIDITTSVEKVVPTSKMRCGPVTRSPGGGGINVARVLYRLGHDVVAVYPAGGPTGKRLENLIGAEGIKSRVVPIVEETRESFTSLEDESGMEYRFVLPGPSISAAETEEVLEALANLERSAHFVVLSGSLPQSVPRYFYARASTIAREAGARVAVDTYGEALAAALRAGGLTVIKPSLRELAELIGSQPESEADRVKACRGLVVEGGVEMVALTMGADGAMLIGADFAFAAEAVPVEVKSAVGAGDSFLGAMVGSLADGKKPIEAFRAAVAAGSAALLHPGTALCLKEDVERLTHQVNVREIPNERRRRQGSQTAAAPRPD